MNSTTSEFQATAGVAPKEMVQVQHLKLNDGNEIPMVGYGAGTAHYKADASSPLDKNLIATFVMAIKTGYYHLDAAQGIITSYQLALDCQQANQILASLWKRSGTRRRYQRIWRPS